MATHFNVLAWEITWTEETGGLQSNGSQKSVMQLNHKTTVLNSQRFFPESTCYYY